MINNCDDLNKTLYQQPQQNWNEMQKKKTIFCQNNSFTLSMLMTRFSHAIGLQKLIAYISMIRLMDF